MVTGLPTPPTVQDRARLWLDSASRFDPIYRLISDLEAEVARLKAELAMPVSILLHCPTCGQQHVDAPELASGWENPPHRSHKCRACGIIWRPADRSTVGVLNIETRGKADDAGYPRREVATALWASTKPYTWDKWSEGDAWDAETGAPSFWHFAGVVQAYAIFQQRERVTVEQVATALNVEWQRVRAAVEGHAWMYLEGPDDQPQQQWIEHEGE